MSHSGSLLLISYLVLPPVLLQARQAQDWTLLPVSLTPPFCKQGIQVFLPRFYLSMLISALWGFCWNLLLGVLFVPSHIYQHPLALALWLVTLLPPSFLIQDLAVFLVLLKMELTFLFLILFFILNDSSKRLKKWQLTLPSSKDKPPSISGLLQRAPYPLYPLPSPSPSWNLSGTILNSSFSLTTSSLEVGLCFSHHWFRFTLYSLCYSGLLLRFHFYSYLFMSPFNSSVASLFPRVFSFLECCGLLHWPLWGP